MSSPRIWLVKDSEPLPIGNGQRLMRTGLLARRLAELGYNVTWFGSRFEHGRKSLNSGDTITNVAPNFRIVMLDGPGYRKNVSLKRILHQRTLARHFREIAATEALPDLILATYPSPELCLAVCKFAEARNIPLIVDVRDPWPDSFAEYFPSYIRWGLSPLVVYYRAILSGCVSRATGVVSMSNVMLDWALSFAGRKRDRNDKVFYLGYERTAAQRNLIPIAEISEENPLRLIFVGMFGMSYDGPMIIRAMRQLTELGERRVVCTLVGRGDYEAQWKHLAADLPSIRFAGWLDAMELQEELSKSHVGIVALKGGISRFWMGNKLFEYASQGLAIINTATGEPVNFLKEKDFGISLAPGDNQQLVQVILRYLSSPELLNRQMKNAQQVFEEELNAKAVYDAYADYVAGLLPEKETKLSRQANEF